MSQSRIPSPARSLGAPVTPRRYKSRTRSVGSPARSTTGRLSALMQFKESRKDSFVLSPAPSRRSVLNDDTDIEEPRRASWWKKIADNSRDVMEVLNDNKILETNEAVEEYIDIEVLSQEKKNYSIDIPDSSDSESISSIVIPQRKLFTQKDIPQNKFGQLIGKRETLAKLHKSDAKDKTVHVPKKNLFGQAPRAKAKPIFPAALLNLSSNKTVNKTKENVAVEVKGQVRNLFGNRAGTKRKNMFADFIVSESEDEISEIQPRVFGFPKKPDTRRDSGNSRGKRDHSPTSSITTDIEMDEWQMLPSSTMVENQLEDMMVAGKTPLKRPRLSNLPLIKESEPQKTAEEKEPSDEEQELKYSDDDKSEQGDQTKQPMQEKPQIDHVVIENDIAKKVTMNKSKEDLQVENLDNIQNNSKGKVQNLNHSKTRNISQKKLNVSTKNTNVRQQNATQDKQDIPEEPMEVDLDQARNEKSKGHVENKILKELQPSKKEATKSKDLNESMKRYRNEMAQIENVQSVTKNNDEVNQTLEKVEDQNNIGESNSHDNRDSNKSQTDNVPMHKDTQSKKKLETTRTNAVETLMQNRDKNDHENEIEVKDQASEIKNQNIDNEEQIKENQNQSKILNDQDPEDHEIANGSELNQSLEEQNESDAKHNKSYQEQNKSDEEVNESEVDNNESEVDHNESEVDHNESEVDHNESEVDHNESEVEHNKNEAEHNKSEVEHNESKLDLNETEAEHNESEVDHNDSEAEHNESEVDHNESEIEALNESQVQDEDENVKGSRNDSTTNAQNESEAEAEESDQETADEDQEEENEQNDSEIENDHDNSEVDMQDESAEVQDDSDDNVQNDDEEMDATQESVEEENDDQNESADEDIEDDEQNESGIQETEDAQNESQEASEDEMQDSDNKQQSDDEQEINETHDTTGRHRKKNEIELHSPEAIRHDNTNELESFRAQGRNTSIRKTTLLKNLDIRPSLAPPRESTGLSDGTRNSSAEGSGWDSHRTTRKTLRQTFGKDFTPRKSLRALVMEKSAKRQTVISDMTAVTSKFPQANSTELQEASMAPDVEISKESNHDVSMRTRQTTLEMYLQKIKKQNMERKLKMEEAVKNSLQAPSRDILNPLKKPMFSSRKQPKVASRPKAKPVKSTLIPLEDLPEEVIEDMKYKPPKRFQPNNASWITKRLYKFLESKLEPQYDYKARVRAEKLVETIYYFCKEVRRADVASQPAADALKHEMARLHVVRTHFDFYQFFHEYMPREIRVKVVPDLVNKINMPRHGVFSDIIRGNTVQG